jgi:type III secretion protein J
LREGVIKLFLIGLFFLSLIACKVELYSNLEEKEANEIMALLLKHGIECSKRPGKENKWVLFVEKDELPRALEILRANGLPRERFVSLGEVFQKKGLVSSPLEERVRFIYALSQELSATISMIDGVISARVFIVLPENNPFQEHIQPASASVFIKCKPDTDIVSKIPKIKKLVINSIEGLSYDKITVVPFVSAEETANPSPSWKKFLGIKVAKETYGRLLFLLGVLTMLFLVSLGCVGYFVVYPRYLKKDNKNEGVSKTSN